MIAKNLVDLLGGRFAYLCATFKLFKFYNRNIYVQYIDYSGLLYQVVRMKIANQMSVIQMKMRLLIDARPCPIEHQWWQMTQKQRDKS